MTAPGKSTSPIRRPHLTIRRPPHGQLRFACISSRTRSRHRVVVTRTRPGHVEWDGGNRLEDDVVVRARRALMLWLGIAGFPAVRSPAADALLPRNCTEFARRCFLGREFATRVVKLCWYSVQFQCNDLLFATRWHTSCRTLRFSVRHQIKHLRDV